MAARPALLLPRHSPGKRRLSKATGMERSSWHTGTFNLFFESTHSQPLPNQALKHDFFLKITPLQLTDVKANLACYRWLNFFPLWITWLYPVSAAIVRMFTLRGVGFCGFFFFPFPSFNNRKQTRLPGALRRPRRRGRCRLRAAAGAARGAARGYGFCSDLQSPRAPFRPPWLRSSPGCQSGRAQYLPAMAHLKFSAQRAPRSPEKATPSPPGRSRCHCAAPHKHSPRARPLPSAQSGLGTDLQSVTPTSWVSPLLKLCKDVWYLIKVSGKN